MRRSSPESIYQAEKAKRQRGLPHEQLMAEAKREFQRMVDDSRAARKGGRPKKAKPADVPDPGDELDALPPADEEE